MMRLTAALRRSSSASASSFSSSRSAAAAAAAAPTPIVELREYALIPAQAAKYVAATKAAAPVRHEHVPTRLCSLPETGGALNVFSHWYAYAGGHPERDAARGGMPQDPRWVDYMTEIRPYVDAQSSLSFVEAPLVESFGLHGMGNGASPGGDDGDGAGSTIYELRRYKLKLSYETVPKFYEHYSRGLPSKLAAEGTHPSTSLVSVLHTEIGMFNEVLEVWRHGAGTHAMEVSRVAARTAGEWRGAIAEIAQLAVDFRSTVHKPVGGGLSKWM